MIYSEVDVHSFEKTIKSMLDHFDTANYYGFNELYPGEPQFPTYVGAMMNKPGLLSWLNDYILAYAAVEIFGKYTGDALMKKLYLEDQMVRKQPPAEYEMPKPTGMDLFGKKRKAYEEWLAQAPQREARRKKAEEAEDARLAKIGRELSEAKENYEVMHRCGPLLLELCKKLNYMHVIAPDYRKSPTPEILSHYLRTNRANTLQEAVNLYHEEQFRKEILELQSKQLKELRHAASLQQTALRRQQEQHAREMAAIRDAQQNISEEIGRIRTATDWIEFYEMMNFWLK